MTPLPAQPQHQHERALRAVRSQPPSALVKLRHVVGISTSAAPPLTDTEARQAETRALEQRVAHIAQFFVLSFLAQLPVALFVGTAAALALDFGGDADR